jgi:hypothetical protein
MTPNEGYIMRTNSRAVAANRLIGHTASAAGIGGAVSLSFLLRELDIFRIAADPPEGAALLITVSLACIFAVGAGVMGLKFLLSDENS